MRLEGSELTPLAGSRTPISENVCTESGTVESQKTPSDLNGTSIRPMFH